MPALLPGRGLAIDLIRLVGRIVCQPRFKTSFPSQFHLLNLTLKVLFQYLETRNS
jgi:hypothetical protein